MNRHPSQNEIGATNYADRSSATVRRRDLLRHVATGSLAAAAVGAVSVTDADAQSGRAQHKLRRIALDSVWGHMEGYQGAAGWRDGSIVTLSGSIEYRGSTLDDYGDEPYEDEVVRLKLDPLKLNEDDFGLEGILIGMLPLGMRPAATQVFIVSSDNLTGNSEIHITPHGEILLALEDESDDDAEPAQNDPQSPECLTDQRRLQRLLRRRRRAAHLAAQRRRRLRRRAMRARRRCGRMVRLKGPSEMSLGNISFVATPAL